MIPGLGREFVTLGSAPDNDVVLAGPASLRTTRAS